MEERRKTTTVRQLEIMFNYLARHKEVALGRVRSKEARAVAARCWRELAESLNAEGPARTPKEWTKVWNDQKCKVRSKIIGLNKNRQTTGGGTSDAPKLTPLEEIVGSIIGFDVGPLAGVRQDQFINNEAEDIIMELEIQNQIPAQEVIEINEADEPHNVLSLPGPSTFQTPEQNMILPSSPPLPPSPVPSLTGQTPQTTPRRSAGMDRVRNSQPRPRRIERATRPRVTNEAQSTRTVLDESRQLVLRIEELRAEAALKNAEAALKNADSFKLIAESIDRFSQVYFQQH